MQIFLRLIFFFYLLASLPSAAQAYDPVAGNVSAALGPYIHQTNDQHSGLNSPVDTGLGLIATGDVNPKGALEVGLFKYNMTYFREKNGMTISEQTDLLEITMGYRYWFWSWLAGSVSFYSTYSMGGVRVLQNQFPAGQEAQTSAHATTMYGFDFDLQQEVWGNQKWGVVLGERYSRSITHRSGEKADQYGAFVGLRYLIQEGTGQISR
jgi:hypothetical protein